ncbi:MAG: hypothetical protein E5W82_09500 [Mesorhizobium sp.]|nr:MAG: hypothetical protein E5W82_09500 [Mesorhizobium sp.]
MTTEDKHVAATEHAGSTDVIDEVDRLLDEIHSCQEEVAALRRDRHHHQDSNGDAGLAASQTRLDGKIDEVKSKLAPLGKIARPLVLGAYNLAASERGPIRFYAGSNPLVLAQDMGAELSWSRAAEILGSITQACISNPDAAKECNRLLDHTSAKRIAEEMDVVSYHAEATRLFDRVRSEFSEASESIRKSLEGTGTDHEELKKLEGDRERLRKIAGRMRSIPDLSDDSDVDKCLKAFETVDMFLIRRHEFLTYEKACADTMREDFGSESSIDAYKDATRPYALRIERQGLFASFWTIGMGLMAGTAVGVLLLVEDNNLFLKNWAIETAAAAALAMYGFSVWFGRMTREGQMLDLRNVLHSYILGALTNAGPVARGRTADARKMAAAIAGQDLSYFKFPKLEWASFALPDAVATDGSIAINGDSGNRRNAHGPQERSDAATNATKRGALTRALAAAARGWLSWRKTKMLLLNAAILAVIVAIPLTLSAGFGTFGGQRTFALISQTPDQGRCILYRGHILLAANNSYYVTGISGGEVNEIPKSAILRIMPTDQLTETGPGRLSDCTELRAKPEPTQISFAAPLEVKQDHTAMLDAAKTIARRLTAGLRTLSEKIAMADGGTRACPQNCQGEARSPVALPVVVPVLVETQPAGSITNDRVVVPTIVTQIFTADGTVQDASSRRMILLPFFTDPVAGKGNKHFGGADGIINMPEEAFYFGFTSLSDPKLSEAVPNKTLVGSIGAALKDCMDATKDAYDKEGRSSEAPKLRLTIEGYASRQWIGAGLTDPQKNDLNWYLAEGRRAAVIRALGIGNQKLIDIGPQPGDVSFTKLAEVDGKKIREGFQFASYKEMNDHLTSFLEPAIPKEVLKRSVAITIENDELARCQKVEALRVAGVENR